MTDDEVNKIIAKFMGLHVHNEHIVTSVHLGRCNGLIVSRLYTTSLDKLIPVWEKMRLWSMDYDFKRKLFTVYPHKNYNTGKASTIQKSAAMATAKAIQEIGEA